VAERLGRRWIGIDTSHLALGLVKHRLAAAFSPELRYEVRGEPATVAEARALAARDPRQLAYWLLGCVGARPVDRKLGPAEGVDGRLILEEGQGRRARPRQLLLAVEPGAPTAARVRALRRALQGNPGDRGALIALDPPGAEAAREAEAKSPSSPGRPVQILTVAQLLAGARLDVPAAAPRPSLARATGTARALDTPRAG
jgi:hypothetical protein